MSYSDPWTHEAQQREDERRRERRDGPCAQCESRGCGLIIAFCLSWAVVVAGLFVTHSLTERRLVEAIADGHAVAEKVRYNDGTIEYRLTWKEERK